LYIKVPWLPRVIAVAVITLLHQGLWTRFRDIINVLMSLIINVTDLSDKHDDQQ
jgi:hypothetical protein